MMGMGKFTTRLSRLNTSVFLKALQKAGSDQKREKYCKPTHSVPNGPMPGRYRRKASTLPNIGAYLNTMKYKTGSTIIRYSCQYRPR